MADLMDVLLSDNAADAVDRPQAPFKWKRMGGVEIPCKGLFTTEIREVRKKATRPIIDPKTKERSERFDNDTFNDELILACTPDAPWTNQQVRDHYGAATAADAMRAALRHPADFGAVLTHCLELCGLTDDAEEAVKNG